MQLIINGRVINVNQKTTPTEKKPQEMKSDTPVLEEENIEVKAVEQEPVAIIEQEEVNIPFIQVEEETPQELESTTEIFPEEEHSLFAEIENRDVALSDLGELEPIEEEVEAEQEDNIVDLFAEEESLDSQENIEKEETMAESEE